MNKMQIADKRKFLMTLLILILCIAELKSQYDAQPFVDFTSNLVFNETVSPIGKDFFDLFRIGWENPIENDDIIIKIIERPIPSMGTYLTILIDDRIVYSRIMRPNRELIENSAKEALAAVRNHVINIEHIKKQLENEDQLGTGIF